MILAGEEVLNESRFLWCVGAADQQVPHVIPIPGSSRPETIRDSYTAIELTLTPRILQAEPNLSPGTVCSAVPLCHNPVALCTQLRVSLQETASRDAAGTVGDLCPLREPERPRQPALSAL
jgi:hypothetical protein